jgi:ankyrin repeat protein
MGMNVNTRGRQGMTPLCFAARSGKTEMVEYLLQVEGIDVSIANDLGQTALVAARVNGEDDVVALLEQVSNK